MTEPSVSLTLANGIARLTLDNPQGRNVIDRAFVDAFAECTRRCAEGDGIAVIVIAARGEFFSVGGNLHDFVAYGDDAESSILALAKQFHVAVAHLYRAEAPVVLALNGMAAGGGFSLVCAADLVIAARSARLTSAYTRTGLTPDGGLTYFLERIVGYRKACEIMMLNPVMTAEDALSWGIVNGVVEDAALESAIDALAAELAQAPANACTQLKTLMRGAGGATLSEQLDREAESISRQAGNPQTIDRLREFLANSAKPSSPPVLRGDHDIIG
jgi:2-(1,2-epoxy-1,2-dihydrophenyl)acetyl-CoA isomerase